MATCVELTEYVIEFIAQNVQSPRVLERIERAIDLLADYPDLGKPYDPHYPAAKPPFPCRSIPVPDTPFTLYYQVVDDERLIVFYAEHQAANPRERFGCGFTSF